MPVGHSDPHDDEEARVDRIADAEQALLDTSRVSFDSDDSDDFGDRPVFSHSPPQPRRVCRVRNYCPPLWCFLVAGLTGLMFLVAFWGDAKRSLVGVQPVKYVSCLSLQLAAKRKKEKLRQWKRANTSGQNSIPWYPSPRGGTAGAWSESYHKAQEMVQGMSLTEKVNITTGVGWKMGLCVGNTGKCYTKFLSREWSAEEHQVPRRLQNFPLCAYKTDRWGCDLPTTYLRFPQVSQLGLRGTAS